MQKLEPLPIVSRQTFTKEVVILDGKRFENCQFIECQLIYSGGPADASACYFSPETVWEFRNHAAIVAMVLPKFGWRLLFGNAETPEKLHIV